MIDDLDIEFDDHDRDRSRHRRSADRRPSGRRQDDRGYGEPVYDDDSRYDQRRPKGKSKGKKKKKKRGKSGLALLLTLLLLGGLAGGIYVAYDKVSSFFVTPDYDGAGNGESITIEIKQGEYIADMANTLVKAGVIKSAAAFIEAAEANSESTGIQPGFYKVSKEMSGASAVTALLDLKNRIVKGITIPEHLISIQIYDKLSKELEIPVADFVAAAKDPVKLGVPDWWFKRNDGKKSAMGVEGFLYPSTYEFPPKPTAETVLKQMIDKFLDVTGKMKFADTVQAKLGGVSPYEALIVASIAQAESLDAKDLGPVARVMFNRVYKDFPCNCLQIDSAVNYSLRIRGKIPKDSNQILRSEQHNMADPYNTFDAPKYSGLPIGPIGNPGEAALRGAMDPPKNDYFYFMTTDSKGTMGYAKDWAGHCRNFQTAVKNKILTGHC
ncbi:UPF0755 protein [Allocatelliglobosispora scoriae]|uniref:Endolytic murein transglycosylase n=1 Tax=Allocatelliglobosispora scoriae TaxID=643052 RepID=A0A841BZV4_9ACTN|nr:endolytic transglycosylase MltG [Allocatelliglobosispora scoriae]MBB5873126.1 UPF0755 protein [Allocatelliglobosispora scoriae]